MSEQRTRPSAEALLKELGGAPRLTVYLAIAPGAGKTRRLLEDAIRAQEAGTRVVIGWVETKGRPDLDELAARIPRVPARHALVGGSDFSDFDFEQALALKPQLIVLDELAHANLPGAVHAKRWQDALALRAAGISVSGAFNIQHLETAAATAEGLIGYPVREIVPVSFLRDADEVVALDVSLDQLEARLKSGAVVNSEDIARAQSGVFRPSTLRALREIMLHTIDDLTVPEVTPRKTSTMLALATGDGDLGVFLKKCSTVADALDLALDVALMGERNIDALAELSEQHDASVVPLAAFDPAKPELSDIKAAVIAVPRGPLANKLVSRSVERDIFVVDPLLGSVGDRELTFSRIAQTAADRLRIGYGRLTIYLGAAAGSGKTYAMLDRAHQLKEAGVDVVGGLIETHGRADTDKKAEGLEILPRRDADCDGVKSSELDLDALLARRPAVAMVDELAHTNAACDAHTKRYDDVLQILRAGISVMTTLNIQHLEGLNDAVYRLTGQRVRETVPDDILSIADEVILIDTTPATLRERLRNGKIYRSDKIDDALAHFFRAENLGALRELALREVVRARGTRRPAPFSRIVLGVKARERDVELIERSARIALRLEVDLYVVHVAKNADIAQSRIVDALADATRRVRARWNLIIGTDPAKALVDFTQEAGGTITVEGVRKSPHWISGRLPLARKLLDGGARQLFVLAPPPN